MHMLKATLKNRWRKACTVGKRTCIFQEMSKRYRNTLK